MLVAAGALVLWLAVAPPAILLVGSGYAAKVVCSNTFVAGREPDEVLAVDVRAPGHPLLRLMRVSVDREEQTVEAGLLGVFGTASAHYKPGVGCALLPDGDLDAARMRPAPRDEWTASPSRAGFWPEGDAVETSDDPDLGAVVDDDALAGPGMRAVVVVKDGRIVAERYGEGFGPQTPLLGWSMTKTVTGVLIGRLVREGTLALDQQELFPSWRDDRRSEVEIADLLGMASDLSWNEGYGGVSDVTRMLYLEPDMAAFARSRPLDEKSGGGIGEVFNYSSGTSVLLSRIWQDALDDPQGAADFPYRELFAPLGMDTAVLETDARGTYVGSSNLYASARDWARLGQFLLQGGHWEGRQLLPAGYVDWMTQPHPASGGIYGRGHVWLRAPNASLPGENPELPEDAFFLSGHDGQSVAIVPSEDLVVVRLGLTPLERGYKVARLVRALVVALREPN